MVLDESSRQPLVTVVIPTYNRAGMVREAVESACDQTYRNLEVLVVDDGSVDSTTEVVMGIGDPRIRYIRQENLGVSGARNRGIRESRGEYIAFLDSDDLLMPDCIRLKVEEALRRPECVLIGAGCRYFGETHTDASQPSMPLYVPGYADFCIFTAFPGGTCNIFVPRSVVDRVGQFDESLRDSEDRDFLRRVAKIGEVAMVQEVLVAIRVHSEIRPNRNIQKVYSDRERVSSRIPEPTLRRRSRAWNAMVVGNLYWHSGRRMSGALWWLKSMLIWPLPLHRELPRLKQVFWKIQSDALP
ncbi:MAG: glycosyltransferase [Gemmatimonadaceae bacterium]|nr:glycosyltransferase [Gemmatimonadaceae bacterium]